MKSSTLPQYTSNPSLVVKNKKQQFYDDEPTTSTYSFRHGTNKLQHAKSHGELYQSGTLSLSPVRKTINTENQLNNSTESPLTTTSLRIRPTATAGNSSNGTQSSPSNKIPLWKRIKKLIVPTKRSKNRQSVPSSKMPALLLDELSENEPSTYTTTD